jgi:peptidoglycan/LPS O-acetylase OafA/YrhL
VKSHRWQAGRLAGLDGMRAFAVLAVFAYHLTNLAPGGWAGVDVFFVLSGYLITGLLIREYRRTSRLDLLGFWGRRGIRLLPALLVTIAMVLAVGWWRAGPGGVRDLWIGAISVLAYVANFRAIHPASMPLFAHLWSLSLEEQFYLTWPLVLWLALRRGFTFGRIAGWLLFAAGLVTANALVQYQRGALPTRVADMPDTHSAGLLLGSALALFLAGHRLSERHRRPVQLAAATIAGAMVVFFALAGVGNGLAFAWGYPVVAAATVVLLIERVSFPSQLLDRVFEARWAVWIGQRSYEIYLVHLPILDLLRRADFGTVSQFLIGFPLTILLSASIHALSRPLQADLRRRLDAGRSRPVGVPAPAAVAEAAVGVAAGIGGRAGSGTIPAPVTPYRHW